MEQLIVGVKHPRGRVCRARQDRVSSRRIGRIVFEAESGETLSEETVTLNGVNGLLGDERGRARMVQCYPKYGRRPDHQDLSMYFRMEFDTQVDGAHVREFAGRLHNRSAIRSVWREIGTRPAQPPSPSDIAACAPSYCATGPSGVDAEAAWVRNGGKGQNVQVCLVDDGCWHGHPALQHLECWPQQPVEDEHGTNCLGVIAANGWENRYDPAVFGIAHELSCWLVSPPESSPGAGDGRIDTAFDNVLGQGLLSPGDIMVVLRERWHGGPIEVVPAYRDVMREAAKIDRITVIEVAGNAGKNLDQYSSVYWGKYGPKGPEDLCSPKHSWAVMVGAGHPPGGLQPALTRAGGTNYGRRVDCQGWGHAVATTSCDEHQPSTWFGGTCAAASLVAGVVAVVQSVNLEIGNAAIEPLVMREALRQTGSQPQVGGQHIGRLPDVAALLQYLGIP